MVEYFIVLHGSTAFSIKIITQKNVSGQLFLPFIAVNFDKNW